MKKIMMTLAAVLCCAMTMTVCTACGDDDDKETPKDYSYTITCVYRYYSAQVPIDIDGSIPDSDIDTWMKSILDAYRKTLSIPSDNFDFTLNGIQSECDKKVYDACKKAEETVKDIRGGSAVVTVFNNTTKKTVYTYNVQP